MDSDLRYHGEKQPNTFQGGAPVPLTWHYEKSHFSDYCPKTRMNECVDWQTWGKSIEDESKVRCPVASFHPILVAYLDPCAIR